MKEYKEKCKVLLAPPMLFSLPKIISTFSNYSPFTKNPISYRVLLLHVHFVSTVVRLLKRFLAVMTTKLGVGSETELLDCVRVKLWVVIACGTIS